MTAMLTYPSPLTLTRKDLIDMEGMLRDQLATFLAFSGHALYFPTEEAQNMPRLLAREHRLLLPLPWEGALLGVCMLHGVKTQEAQRLLPFLPAVANLCLGNMARAKALRTDALTGLATADALFARMEENANRLRACLDTPGTGEGSSAPLHMLCMGIAVVRVVNGPSLVRREGYAFAADVLRTLAEACRAHLQANTLVARIGQWDFALLFPAGGRRACHTMAETVLECLDHVSLTSPLLHTDVRPRLCAGHALYPQDMLGVELKLDMYEQSRRCVDRARLAAEVGSQRSRGGRYEELRIMPFARILHEGGVVLATQPMGRLRISVGRQAKAREGMRFAVWHGSSTSPPQYRGDVVILRTFDSDSVAEPLHLTDTANQPEPGDRLLLVDAAVPAYEQENPDSMEDERTLWPRQDMTVGDVMALPCTSLSHEDAHAQEDALGDDESQEAQLPFLVPMPTADEQHEPHDTDAAIPLRSHGEFLHRFSVEAEHCRRFTLVLLHVKDISDSHCPTDTIPCAADTHSLPPFLITALSCWRQTVASVDTDDKLPMIGLYGSTSLNIYHPNTSAENLVQQYEELSKTLRQHHVDSAVGLAEYPFLRYRKGEIADCAAKALEYALLLPEPKVGICNSLALNISADKLYSLGDVFGAMEEYKRALLVDDANVTARNSLGVCLAAVGRGHEARRYFTEALQRNPDKATLVQIYYNLGSVCQNLDDRRAAWRYYRRCVQIDPQHLFAHIRLGQLSETAGRKSEARRFYEQAAAIEDAHPGTPNVARRHLARVAARQRKGREARELLHEALLRNPEDAASLLLLANIYLDSQEDPAIAEMLARKSAALYDRPDAWHTLARALRALNREEDARLAEAKAVLP